MFKKGISRRSFIKTGIAAGTILTVGSWLSFEDWLQASEQAEIKVTPSLCNACSSRCGVFVHVKNGRLWKVSGNPDHPRSRGRICARAHGYTESIYSPDRITQPLKRKDDEFVPITWEEAYKEIASKLKKIISDHGTESVFYMENPKESGKFYGWRFMDALGVATRCSHHATCSNSRDSAFEFTLGGVPSADVSASKYLVFVGRSYADGIRPSSMLSLLSAKEKGAKIIVIDPRYNNTAPLADKWLPIRPGTDLAMLLAIAHVLIKEELYDKEFVYTNGVGFDEFAVEMSKYTPEWAAEITGLAAEDIIEIAQGLGKNKPKCLIEPSWKGAFGCNYENSTETGRIVALINAMLGNIGRFGGLIFGKSAKLGKLDPEKHPEPEKAKGPRLDGAGKENPLIITSKGAPQLVMEKAKEGKAKAGFINHFNPVRNFPDPQHMTDGFKSLDLLVVTEIVMSETALLADYILPEPSFLERTEMVEKLSGKKPTLCIRAKAIETIHPDTRPFPQQITELAQEMGIGQYFNFTVDDLNRASLAPLGITYEELLEKGAITIDDSLEEGFPKLKTESEKVEFVSEAFKKAGFSAVPKWIPPLKNPSEGEFRLIHGKQAIHSHTSTVNSPYLAQISKDYDLDRLWINGSKAKEMGLKDGDWVVMESSIATGRIQVKVTERLHPEAVYIPSHYGSYSEKLTTASNQRGLSMNDFIEYQVEAMSGAANMMEVVVKVRKEGA